MKVTLVILLAMALLSPCPALAQTQADSTSHTQSSGLTVDLVVKLIQAGVSPDRVVELIQQSPSSFDLSLQALDSLRNVGVPATVIDAMLKSGRGGRDTRRASNLVTPRDDRAREAGPDRGASESASTSVDSERLRQARAVRIPADKWNRTPKQDDPRCPNLGDHGKVHRVDLDFETGSSSEAHLCSKGLYCFALRNANALYDWEVKVNVTEPTGNPLDLLNEAIQALKNISTGADNAANKAPTEEQKRTARVERLVICSISSEHMKKVKDKAAALAQALAALEPGKDSNGKTIYIPVATTQRNWAAVETPFNEFKGAVLDLQTDLKGDISVCPSDVVEAAVAIILDDFPKAQEQIQRLDSRLSRPDVYYHERSLDPTDTADLVATPSYARTAGDPKTFHFSPCFGIVSASAGFLLTRLQPRAYASATAPDPNDPTKTQNVLRVDYGAGIRPALAALLTGNIPHVNWRNYGFGITAGVVFDVSNGKADTSRFGFFGGPSLRLTPWVYLTPGVHFGEFADFPQGFTHPGQVIPANIGTPTPTKRYTGRFAFSVTFKIKDLGATTPANDQTGTQKGGSKQ